MHRRAHTISCDLTKNVLKQFVIFNIQILMTTSKTKIKKDVGSSINHQNVITFKHKIFIDTSVSIFFNIYHEKF